MILRAMRKDKGVADTSSVWLSIGDLMSVLLLLFVMLLVLTLYQLQKTFEETEQTRVMIIQALKEKLSADGIEVEINPKSGDVSLTSSILFDLNKYELKQEGKDFLKSFIPIYSQVVFSTPAIEKEVVRVIVEGHTSSLGDFSHNMSLSVRRALAVSTAIEKMNFPNKKKFLYKLMTAGRGEIEANKAKDDSNDRKVKFRFEFRGMNISQLIKKVYEQPMLGLEKIK